MTRTNPRTPAAVVRHLNLRFQREDIIFICYEDDQREGYFVKAVIDEPEGVVLPINCSQYRDWFGAHMNAVKLLPIITRAVEELLRNRDEVLGRRRTPVS